MSRHPPDRPAAARVSAGRPDFDLRQLEIFCQVVDHASITRAAAAVHLAQSSVSERIANLETTCGAPLLDRIGRQVVPTAIGKRLYERARELLALGDAVRADLRGMIEGTHGRVVVGASTIPGEFILPGVLARFRARQADSFVSVVIGDTDEIVQQVTQGRVELGVVGARDSRPHLQFRQLWEDELMVVVGADHPWAGRRFIGPAELRPEPFVLRETGSATRRVCERYLARLIRGGLDELSPVAEFSSTTAVKEAVQAGLGVAILSARAVTSEVSAGLLHTLRLRGLRMRRHFYLAIDRRRRSSPLCERLVAFMVAQGRTDSHR